MATINDLHQSISDMTNEQAMALIRRIRQSRITMKVTKFTARAAKSAPKKMKKDPLAGIDKLELIKLLKESLK